MQVKRTDQKISVEGVRSFLALIEEDDVGLFVAAGGFTRAAEEFARMARRKIELFDLERLFDLWVEFYPKLDEMAQERLPISPRAARSKPAPAPRKERCLREIGRDTREGA